MSKKKIEATLNDKDLELVKGIVVEVVEPMKKDIEFLKAQLSGDNAPHKDDEVGKDDDEKHYPLVSTFKPNNKGEMRCYIDATEKIPSTQFNKVYELVKKYKGAIVHRKEDKFAHWSFTENDGKKFAKAVVKANIF